MRSAAKWAQGIGAGFALFGGAVVTTDMAGGELSGNWCGFGMLALLLGLLAYAGGRALSGAA